MFDRNKPYNDLPLLPPNRELETKEVLKKAISANARLAELKGIANRIPNQTILINFLTLQEARSSSEIENIVTTNDKLFEAFSLNSAKGDPETKEVLRYKEAMWEGYQALQKKRFLTTNLFVNVCNTIKKNQSGVRKTTGTKIGNQTTKEIIYTPPEGERVILKKLKNLEDYIHDDSDLTDPLIKMAVIHYQFEAIHPFSDGNGRTGRILNILYLILNDMLDLPILYLSQYIIANKDKYYKHLSQVTEENEWQGWIMYMLDGIEQTATSTRNKIIEINDLFECTLDYAKQKLPNYMYSKELIELIFEQPYCKVKFLVDKDIAQRQQASKYLYQLESIGILQKKKVGKEQLFLNTKLFELLSNLTPHPNNLQSSKSEGDLFETLDSNLETWEEMFLKLKGFIEKHGHSYVSKRDQKTRQLGHWVTDQRKKKKSNLLSREQITKLEEIDMDWDPINNRWENNYKELVKFKKANGHCDVPQRYAENQEFSNWVFNQRYRYKIKKLSNIRTKKLEKIGFNWGRDANVSDDRIKELLEYKKKFGHLNASQVDPNEEWRGLGKWLNNQRHAKKKGTLSAELEEKLNEIGVAWNALEANWDKKLGELKDFHEIHGHFRVPQNGEISKLGYWIAKIRRVKPNADRMKKLSAIGFDWDKEKVK